MKKFLFVTLHIFASILALGSIISIYRNAEMRYIKMLDFPRIQFFILSAIVFILLITTAKKWKWYSYLLIIGLAIGIVINSTFLIHYTKLVSVEVLKVEEQESTANHFSLLWSNIKMSNKEAQKFIELVEFKNPDLVLAMEVDQWWNEELKVLEKKYPFSQHSINEVTYGMVLYSKFPIENAVVNYLTNEEVPSFESSITLSSGNKFALHSIHPVPPTHFEDLPDNGGEKENALMKLGKKLEVRKYPTVVAGDMNDVVWSHIDDLTKTQNILYDVRVGRGFYNSYNANNFFMRWPLDHVFVTEEFRLKKFERLQKIGSDHFPMYVELVF